MKAITREDFRQLYLPFLVRLSNWWIGGLTMTYALNFTAYYLQAGYTFTVSFVSGWPIPLRFPFTNLWYMGIFPISLFMLGFMVVLYNGKFGWRAIPMVMMTAGAYDFINHHNILHWEAYTTMALWPQVIAMIAGWFIAGMPSFRLSGKWFFIALAGFYFFTTQGFPYPSPDWLDVHVYQALFFIFVYKNAYFKPKRNLPEGTYADV